MNNLGITFSFVIGGLLIISILTLNGRVIQNSGETVLNMTAKNTVQSVNEIMRLDFQRLGYNLNSSVTDTIEAFNENNNIQFWADTDTIESTPAEKITWKITSNSVTTTSNPHDFKLIRTTSGSSDDLVFPVTKFRLKAFDKAGNATNNRKKIKSIYVYLETESPETYGNNQYSKSIWEKTFIPPNLKLQDFAW